MSRQLPFRASVDDEAPQPRCIFPVSSGLAQQVAPTPTYEAEARVSSLVVEPWPWVLSPNNIPSCFLAWLQMQSPCYLF